MRLPENRTLMIALIASNWEQGGSNNRTVQDRAMTTELGEMIRADRAICLSLDKEGINNYYQKEEHT